jgi:hypothetical protein
MLGTDKMGASTPLAEACEMSALAIHRERDPSQPQSSRVSLWQYLFSISRRRRRRRRSLLRIVHARGAIPNEMGSARCRATKEEEQHD